MYLIKKLGLIILPSKKSRDAYKKELSLFNH
jgi:hypothetical protein